MGASSISPALGGMHPLHVPANRDSSPTDERLADVVIEHAGALVVVLDAEGRIVRFNRACEELSGLSEAEVLGRFPQDAVHFSEEVEGKRREVIERLLARREADFSHHTSCWSTPDGDRRWIRWSNTAVPCPGGESAYVVSVGTDTTELRRAGQQLRRYAQIVDQIPDSVVSIELDGTVTSYNRASELIFGYREDDVLGRHVSLLYPESGQRAVREQILPTLRAKGSLDVELDVLRKDGRTVRARQLLSMLCDDEGRPVGMIGCTIDVSGRVRAMEELATSERRLRELNESLEARIEERTRELEETHRAARFGTWTWDFPSGDLEWSDQVFALFGYPPRYVDPSFDFFLEHVHPDDRALVLKHVEDAVAGIPYDVEFRVVQRLGDMRWALARGEVIRDADGQAIGMRGTCIDINERRVAEEKLRASLRQKELLLQEVHHRVKNNLAMVSAFLQLQQQVSVDAAAVAALRECEHRVQAMASVHRLLYQSEDLDTIFAQTLFEALCSALKSGSDRPEVEIAIRANDIHLTMDVAIPCAMIVNELLSNALKHGFGERESGNIDVCLDRAEEQRLRLTVQDDGKGLPEATREGAGGSLGLQLVDVFARQLRAEVRVERLPTRFDFEFEP